MIINSQSDIEMAIKIYNTVHPSLHDMKIFRLELDACLRWCSLLLEQNDLKVNISLFHTKFFFYLSYRNTEMILMNISNG